MYLRFQEFFLKNNINLENTHFYLAVSGGVDSVVLTHLFHEAKASFTILHCNFNLRGRESLEDEQFVAALANEYFCKFMLKNFNTRDISAESNQSIQMIARNLRYDWFKEVLKNSVNSYLVTAHHANDQLETILFNLTKGTGISGLRGMPAVTDEILRPLLGFEKGEIIAYAKHNKLKWREDSSNHKTEYHRNLIRKEVVPVLLRINPSLLETLEATLFRIQSTEMVLNERISVWKRTLFKKQEDHILIPKNNLQKESNPEFVIYCLLKEFGFNLSQCRDIIRALESSGKVFYAESYFLNIDRSNLILGTIPENNTSSSLEIELEEGEFTFGTKTYKCQIIQNTAYELSHDPWVGEMDWQCLKFPLTIRYWAAGDRIQPAGMKGRKKVSDLLVDEKVPVPLKKKVPVFLSQNEVIWVPGFRLSEKVKVTPKTEKIFKIYSK
jgi:tRNA(Ile)-lysidine synthase